MRSVRVGRRVIQQAVAQLGELDERGRIEARALARRLIGAPEEAPLFDDGSQHLTAPVRLKGVRVERSRRFGDVYLALAGTVTAALSFVLTESAGPNAFSQIARPVTMQGIADELASQSLLWVEVTRS